MQHLVKTCRTHEHLEVQQRKFAILDFFFDFRATTSTANNVFGLIKTFLLQISKRFPQAEDELAQINTRSSIQAASLDELVELLTDTVRELPTQLCAFIDGLDEYTGDYGSLSHSLAQIQHQTGMKICIACRPEFEFRQYYKDVPTIRMQDHNGASIAVYIDKAINKGRATLLNIDAVLDDFMRQEILQRAQGVIIWARLAVDELLNAAKGRATREEMFDILTHLPEDLEEMYTRNLKKLPDEHRKEAAFLLYMIALIGNGSLPTAALCGLRSFYEDEFFSDLDVSQVDYLYAFDLRLQVLLASSVDYIDANATVRLMHETLQRYIRTSSYVQDLLPPGFTHATPRPTKLSIYADIFQSFSEEEHVDELFEAQTPMDFLQQSRRGSPREHRLISSPRWKIRSILLSVMLANLFECSVEFEGYGTSSYAIMKPVLSSPLILLADTNFSSFTERPYSFSTESVSFIYTCQNYWIHAREAGCEDLVIAATWGLHLYVNESLSHISSSLPQQYWQELFTISVCMLNEQNSDGRASARKNTQPLDHYRIDKEIDPLEERKAIALAIRSHCKALSPTVLEACLSRLKDLSVCRRFVCEILLSVPISVPTFGDEEFTSYQELLSKWVTIGDNGQLSKTILHILLKVLPGVNLPYQSSHSLLYQYASGLSLEHRHGRLGKFLLLVRLNADSTLKYRDQTPLEFLKAQHRKRLFALLLFFGTGGFHNTIEKHEHPQYKHVVEMLQYHKKHGKWPDISKYVRKESESSIGRWMVDSAGCIALGENSIDRTGL